MNFSSVIPPDLLLQAYRQGYFPMSQERHTREVGWFFPEDRGVFPMDGFSLSKNTQRLMRNRPHEVRFNTAFEDVMLACGEREETWISDVILESYANLHRMGHAHSVEIWKDDKLVGGLYGVTQGAAFFGESMFKREPEMDKFALGHCHRRLVERGFLLWDTQYYTDHLGTMGCVEIPSDVYLILLASALRHEAKFG